MDNKPPKSVSPFDAFIRLRKAAESFGDVWYKIAYANQCLFDYVPPKFREHRRYRDALPTIRVMQVILVYEENNGDKMAESCAWWKFKSDAASS
ncbi:zinc finger, C2H2-like, PIN domain-like protein [Artemisia annua]|uniref:Zinc finger, C2H2-like, PIN domain-like protein n=1 Tax=Artemisia annua TaxID=35608 RepID=A0A2U1LCT9_ARTAN|nr:zinc finger, C2H2-like, PIN domain-like protein [Artemisia annua]